MKNNKIFKISVMMSLSSSLCWLLGCEAFKIDEFEYRGGIPDGGDGATAASSSCEEIFPDANKYLAKEKETDHCYAIYLNKLNWIFAADQCSHGRGYEYHLATISNLEELKFITVDFKGLNGSDGRLWLGGIRPGQDKKKFEWINKENWMLKNDCNGSDPMCLWSIIEADDPSQAQQPDGIGDCIRYRDKGEKWVKEGLDDHDCSDDLPFICEWNAAVN